MSLLGTILLKLENHFGDQQWWPAESNFEIMVGAILTQNTSWSNAEKAIRSLKNADVLDVETIYNMSSTELQNLVYPSGFYRLKARRIKTLAASLMKNFGGDADGLRALSPSCARAFLLKINGIGPETADCMLLYAIGKPIFVIDSYTKRLMQRIGVGHNLDTYDHWQQLFMKYIPPSLNAYQQYHALIVAHSKLYCTSTPACSGCPLSSLCKLGQSKKYQPAIHQNIQSQNQYR